MHSASFHPRGISARSTPEKGINYTAGRWQSWDLNGDRPTDPLLLIRAPISAPPGPQCCRPGPSSPQAQFAHAQSQSSTLFSVAALWFQPAMMFLHALKKKKRMVIFIFCYYNAYCRSGKFRKIGNKSITLPPEHNPVNILADFLPILFL